MGERTGCTRKHEIGEYGGRGGRLLPERSGQVRRNCPRGDEVERLGAGHIKDGTCQQRPKGNDDIGGTQEVNLFRGD